MSYPEWRNILEGKPRLSKEDWPLIEFRDRCLGEFKSVKEQLGITRREERSGKFLSGEGQWPKDIQEKKKYYATVVVNLVRSVVERKTGTLTESRPQLDVKSTKHDEAVADILKKTAEGVFGRRSVQQGITDGVIIAQRNGNAPCSVTWEPSLNYGLGDVSIEFLPTQQVSFDPS